jgi:hypothetical protein
MTRNGPLFVLFLALLVAVVAQTASCASNGMHATFKTSNGGEFVLDTRTATLRTPRSDGTALQDCSDQFQTCMTDHHGFAFSFFRRCKDAEIGDFRRLRFHPKVVVDLHDNLWMVFDASPNYMFHYVVPKGIVGIYVGPTTSYDFRGLFHERNLRIDNLDATEYRIAGSDSIAACGEE